MNTNVNTQSKNSERKSRNATLTAWKNKIIVLCQGIKFADFVKSRQGKWLLISLGLLSVLWLLTLLLAPHGHAIHSAKPAITATQSPLTPTEMLTQELHQVTDAIANGNQLTQNEVTQLQQQIAAMQTRLQQLSDQNDLKQMNADLTNANQALTQKLAELDEHLNTLKQTLAPHTFLDAKKLPFTIVSVDLWNGTPYATIALDGQEDLVGVNESRAGWTVDAMDFAQRQIIFRNAKDQYVKVQLEN